MDEITLFLVLMVFSYLGNVLVVPGQSSTITLPSGAQFIALGFLFGPYALGVVSSDAARSFLPLASVATAWLALVFGVSYGFVGERRLSVRAYVVGFVIALLSAAVIALLTYPAARFFLELSERDALLVSLGIGLAGSETTRQSVRWALDRGAESGPLLQLMEELAGSDELVPLVGLAGCFMLTPQSFDLNLPAHIHANSFLLTLFAGALLGLTSALLLAGLSAAQEAWIVILGASLLGTGIASRLSLSPLTTLFVMGVCLSLASRHAPELRPLLVRTAPGVLLPALLLAGALLRVPTTSGALTLVCIALLVRTLTRILLGHALARAVHVERERRAPFGLALCCTGSINMLVGLSFALRVPGQVGELVLGAAAASALLGDLVGTLGLRQTFLPRTTSDIAQPVAAS